MAEVAAEKIIPGGLTPSYTAAASSQTVRAGNDRFLHVKNGDGSDHTITLETPATDAHGNAVADLVVNVPAGSEEMIGPLDPNIYGQGGTDQITITWSATTSMTFACLILSR